MAQRPQGENLVIGLQGHDLNIVAMDGITTPNLVTVPSAPRSSWVLAAR